MDLEKAQYVDEHGTLLIRFAGVQRMPSFHVYKL